MNASRESYRALKEKTESIIEQYDKLAELVYTPEELVKKRDVLNARRKQLETQEFILVVIGEMKHGKSTFLNAMLRKPVFPKDVREATAAVTFLRHNDTIAAEHPEWRDKAVVEFRDRPTMVVDHLDLGKYTTCLHKGEVNVAEDVKSVTIYSDSKFVEDGVTVVDTPGMNTPNAMHEQITRDQIDRSHAAVFLFKAGEAGKKSDYEFLETTAKKIERFFFVVNRIDEIGGIGETSARVIEDLRGKVAENPVLGPLLEKERFYPTSGLLALLGRYPEFIPNEKFLSREQWERDCNPPDCRAELEKASGMDTFEADLLSFLFNGPRTQEFLRSHLAFLRGAADEASRYLVEQAEALSKKTNLKELEEKEKRLEAEFEREQAKVASASTELTKKLKSAMSNLVKECEMEAETKTAAFDTRVNEICDYDVMRSQFEEFSGEIERTVSRFASRAQIDMKDTAQSVFSAIDYKVRGELNKRLGAAKLFVMPELEAPKISWVVPENVAKDVEVKLKQIETELRDVDQKLSEKSGSEWELKEALRAREELERQKADALEDIRSNMQMLGQRPGIEQRMVSPAHDKKEWRDGLLGFVMTPIIGKKTVHYEAEFEEDDSARRAYDSEMAKLKEKDAAFRESIRKRLEEAGKTLSEAQRAQLEMEQLRKLADKKREKEMQLQRELRERQLKAQEVALVSMRKSLSQAMKSQLEDVVNGLRTMSNSCANWAQDYIGGIQAELCTAVAARRDELENLRKTVALKKKDRDALQAKVEEAKDAHAKLIADAEVLFTEIEMMSI